MMYGITPDFLLGLGVGIAVVSLVLLVISLMEEDFKDQRM